MSQMFYDCKNLSNINLSNFDNQKIDNISAMFYNSEKFKILDIFIFKYKKCYYIIIS